MDLFDLSGRVALVTGASRGIGEAIALLLARHGAHVLVASRRIDDCRRVAETIRVDGGKSDAFACNIGSLEDISCLFRQVRESCGQLDILINNAATNPYFGPVIDTDPEAFQKTVDVNIRGYFFMSAEAAKMMKGQGGGVIVNTASVNALRPAEMQGIYSITKAAVVSMTKAFAKECGPYGVRCNALLPGFTKTRLTDALFDDEGIYNKLVEQIPLGRHAEPEEMAGSVLYLVSDAGAYTNGACIVVDGGYTI